MMSAAPEVPLDRSVIEAGYTVAQPALGLTAYLAEPAHWASGGARQVLKRFLAVVPTEYLKHLATSTSDVWRDIGVEDHESVADALAPVSVHTPIRHLFWIRLAQDIGAPALAFHYTEVDPARADRSAVIELTFPQGFDRETLISFVRAIVETGPVHSIIGGLVLRWDDRHRVHAFSQLYRWASRYVGFDIQQAEEMAFHTPRALPGSNWLTYVGPDVAGATVLDLDALVEQPFKHGVVAERLDEGVLVRAGSGPVQGDLNRLNIPYAYCEAAKALERAYDKDPPTFWGRFAALEETPLWFRRFLEPDAWTNREVDLDEAIV